MIKKFNEKIIIFSIILVPIFTIILNLKYSPFQYSFSRIGYWFEYTKFIAWGILVATLIFIAIIKIYKKANFENKKAITLLILSIIFLLLTVFTPIIYETPIDAELDLKKGFNYHALYGTLFLLLIIISLYSFSKHISTKDKNAKSITWFNIMIGSSFLILLTFGLKSISQLYFFTSLSIFLLITNEYINKNQKIFRKT